MSSTSLDALSPVDGRYRAATEPLRGVLSEGGLIRERIRVEALWVTHLAAAAPRFAGSKLPAAVRDRAADLAKNPPADAAETVKAIEAKINHDVKAVEYYVRGALAAAGASEATLELVHFGCTSEDINNVSYARMLASARDVLSGNVEKLINSLTALAHKYADLAMLARTHVQPATPTTLGKEVANFVARIRRAEKRWTRVAILGKWNGAVGNFNAHVAAAPDLDWPTINRTFVEALGLQHNDYTTQIEPHDWIAEYCDAIAAIDTVLIDLCRDFWGYISLGYFRQRPNANEVGSSTMPHKVNPIDFENAEGNLGVALGHALIGWRSLERGLTKIEASPATLAADIDDAWEVLGEAVQTVLRAAGVPNGYERLKDLTRGQAIDAASLSTFIDTLPISAAEKARLKKLSPKAYTGLASKLARDI